MTKEQLEKEYLTISLEEINENTKLILKKLFLLEQKMENLEALLKKINFQKGEKTQEVIKEIQAHWKIKEHLRLPSRTQIYKEDL